LRFEVQGLGFINSGSRVQGSGFKVQGSGFSVQGSGFRIQDSGFEVQDSGSRAQEGFRSRVQSLGCGGPGSTTKMRPSVLLK
jgi:hypothetical protein